METAHWAHLGYPNSVRSDETVIGASLQCTRGEAATALHGEGVKMVETAS